MLYIQAQEKLRKKKNKNQQLIKIDQEQISLSRAILESLTTKLEYTLWKKMYLESKSK